MTFNYKLIKIYMFSIILYFLITHLLILIKKFIHKKTFNLILSFYHPLRNEN